MKIEFTEKQYADLLKLVYLGELVAERIDEEKLNSELFLIAQHVYSHFKDFGAEELIEFAPKQKEYFPSMPFEKSMEQYVDSYNDLCFWESLEDKLSARDLVLKMGPEKAEKLSFEERFKLTESIAQQYEEEFIENGVRNLYLKKESCCSDHNHHH